MVEAGSGSRLLIISTEFPPGPGGIGNHAYNLAKYLQEFKKVKVTVLADTNFTSEKELDGFDSKTSFKVHRILRTTPIHLTYIKRVIMAWKLISQNDKIVFSGKFSIWLAGMLRSFFKKKEFIAVVHGSELDLQNKRLKKFTNESLNKCDKIISVSRYTEKHLPILRNGQQRKIIANGIDLTETSTIKIDINNTIRSKSLKLLTVGNVTPRKGQKNIIRALPEIKKVFPNVHYHIIGLPTQKDALTEFAKELGVLPNITFHGKISRQQLLDMYRQCDIFMMLSDHTATGDFEGFGIAVLEANIWGKPAVGSKNSGIADAIDNGETGILVDQHNDHEIANAIALIYNNYETFSAKAYKWALEHNWKNIANQYYEVLYDN
ncbi:MAG: glycosyltransferase family 4 protein [Bacteroidota bacterium]|nr:glycosyltransferase family 4 protein [Bacteroidota bacterium]